MEIKINFSEDEYLSEFNDIVNKIQSEVDKMLVKSTKGLADALLFVATESQQRAPVDKGDLRGSVKVNIDSNTYIKGWSSDDGKSCGVEVVGTLPEKAKKGSVSFNTEYAAQQHEQINYKHENGQAKYLESVIIENQDRILNCIADKIRGDE